MNGPEHQTPIIPEQVKESVTLMIGGKPEVLFLMSGGISQRKDGTFRPTTIMDPDLDDGTNFGYLAGVNRMLATEQLATIYPNTPIITNSSSPGTGVSHAEVYAKALVRRGVEQNRIEQQAVSQSTRAEFREMVKMCLKRDWKGPIALITNDYHIERSVLTFATLGNLFSEDQEFLEELELFRDKDIKVLFVNSEKVLDLVNPKYKQLFANLRTKEPFAREIEKREIAEANGIKALRGNTYQKRS